MIHKQVHQKKPIIIGQAPARGSDRPFQGRSGDRLRQMTGVNELEEYFTLINLFPNPEVKIPGQKGDRFHAPSARARAARIWTTLKREQPPLVMLMGRNVEKAFFGPKAHHEWLKPFKTMGLRWVVCPHPSGVSHWWNSPENIQQMRSFLRGLIHG